MMFTILFIAFLLIAFVIYLPYASGLTKFEKNPKTKKQTHPSKPTYASASSSSYSGYLPPDELKAQQEKQQQEYDAEHSLKGRASALKEKINVTSDDIPVRIALSEHASLRHRNKEKLDNDTNPNNYDYDLDELIEEETQRAVTEQRQEFYQKEKLGQDKEAMV